MLQPVSVTGERERKEKKRRKEKKTVLILVHNIYTDTAMFSEHFVNTFSCFVNISRVM